MALFDVTDSATIAEAFRLYGQAITAIDILFPGGTNAQAVELRDRGRALRAAADLKDEWFGLATQGVDGSALQALQDWDLEAAGFIQDYRVSATPDQEAKLAALYGDARSQLVLESAGSAAWTGAKESVAETAGQYGQALADVGTGVRNTLSLGKYLPLLVVGAVVFYAFVLYKKG